MRRRRRRSPRWRSRAPLAIRGRGWPAAATAALSTRRRRRPPAATVYQASCASCHLPDLAGRNEAPQLAGNNFMNTWRTRTTRDLFEFIQSTMPPTGENLSVGAVPRRHRVHSAGERRAGGHAAADADDRRADRQLGVRPAPTTAAAAAAGTPAAAAGRAGPRPQVDAPGQPAAAARRRRQTPGRSASPSRAR